MLCQEHEEDQSAPQQPGFSTPTKASRNDGAGHGSPYAGSEETKAESDPDVEKELGESTGKKRDHKGYLNFTVVKQCTTGEDAESEDEDIEHEIYTLMKKFMQQSRMMKDPAHRDNPNDIIL